MYFWQLEFIVKVLFCCYSLWLSFHLIQQSTFTEFPLIAKHGIDTSGMKTPMLMSLSREHPFFPSVCALSHWIDVSVIFLILNIACGRTFKNRGVVLLQVVRVLFLCTQGCSMKHMGILWRCAAKFTLPLH